MISLRWSPWGHALHVSSRRRPSAVELLCHCRVSVDAGMGRVLCCIGLLTRSTVFWLGNQLCPKPGTALLQDRFPLSCISLTMLYSVQNMDDAITMGPQ